MPTFSFFKYATKNKSKGFVANNEAVEDMYTEVTRCAKLEAAYESLFKL